MKYPFRCPECGFDLEVEAAIQDGPTAPACLACSMFSGGFVWMRRVWSAVPAIFRGGGWASKS